MGQIQSADIDKPGSDFKVPLTVLSIFSALLGILRRGARMPGHHRWREAMRGGSLPCCTSRRPCPRLRRCGRR